MVEMEVIVIRVGLKSAPDAGVSGRKGRVGRGIGASGCSVVVEDVSVCLGEGRKGVGNAGCVVGLFWECPVKESSGGGVCHLVPREGSVAGCPHYAGMREGGALSKDGQGKS